MYSLVYLISSISSLFWIMCGTHVLSLFQSLTVDWTSHNHFPLSSPLVTILLFTPLSSLLFSSFLFSSLFFFSLLFCSLLFSSLLFFSLFFFSLLFSSLVYSLQVHISSQSLQTLYLISSFLFQSNPLSTSLSFSRISIISSHLNSSSGSWNLEFHKCKCCN